MVAYRMLGALEAAADGVCADLGPPKQRALLAVLLLHSGEIVPVDVLVDALWVEAPPRQAQHAIQVYVSDLRRALAPLTGEEVIAWRPPGYLLAADPASVDSHRFEELVAAGVGGAGDGDPAAAGTLREALALWHGPPLADFAYEEFAQPAIRRLTELRLLAIETLAGLELGSERDAEAATLAEAAASEDPLRERAREIQMLALYRLGRHADALRVYEDLRTSLADEVGAEPSPALRELQERILLHDSALRGTGREAAREEVVAGRNPYKGLRAFGEDDAVDFFGREALVGRLLDMLASGARLIALVGPSGCGKSSVLHAGLVPRLRAGAGGGAPRAVISIRTGAGLEATFDAALAGAADRPVVVLDQFEELFTAGEDEVTGFLTRMARVIEDPAGSASVVLALRADAYDKPLLHARFAPVFLAGVVNVVPMSAAEIEDAIVRPARGAGLDVEPGLLAELIADTVDRRGALPLLQHTLAELFDRRTGTTLTLTAYRELGGLRAALARRAEAILADLDEAHRGVTRQVFLRLVRPGDGGRDALRRVPVRELADLGLDPVALSDVLVAFDRGRLVSLDRDAAGGGATVEIAHEALLTAWDRLAAWIEEHRLDLARRASLAHRAAEWRAAGRGPEDLLGGARLDELAAWSAATTVALTADERAFLDESLRRRDAQLAAEADRVGAVRRLERRARVRLAGLVAVLVLLVGATAWAVTSWPGSAPGVVLVYPGPGDGGMHDSIAAGFDAAVARDGLDAQVVVEDPERLEDRLRRLAGQGVDLLVVGYPWGNPDVERAARDNPGTRFLSADYHGELPNVSAPVFGREEGAFLVGAAAALESRTGIVGIVIDHDTDHGWPYAAGFEAGVRAVDLDARVLTSYLGEGWRVHFGTVNGAVRAHYRDGADVVFYAGDAAPLGAFEAAYSESQATGRQLWAVALDTDWFVVLPLVGSAGDGDTAAWRSHVLTSLVTHYDAAFSTMLDDYAAGMLASGIRRFGLGDGVFELAESGGFLDASLPALAALRQQVVDGRIDVPALPDDRGPYR